jgi:hypothetical protein
MNARKKKREGEREKEWKSTASMASINLLQTAGLVGFAHAFRPYLTIHKRWIPICCGKRSACDPICCGKRAGMWSGSNVDRICFDSGLCGIRWMALCHLAQSNDRHVVNQANKKKTNKAHWLWSTFFLHNIILIFCIKFFAGSWRYKWNKEFLKERREKKISNLYYKVNFAQKENILKAQKCWINSPFARNMWQIEYLVEGVQWGICWSAVHKCTQMVSCSMSTKLRGQNLTKFKFPFG